MPEATTVIIPLALLLLVLTLGGLYVASMVVDRRRKREVQRNWDNEIAELDSAQTVEELDLPATPTGYRWLACDHGDEIHLQIVGKNAGEEVIVSQGALMSADEIPDELRVMFVQQLADSMLEGLAEGE